MESTIVNKVNKNLCTINKNSEVIDCKFSYEQPCYSDNSEKEPQLINIIHQFSTTGIPSFQLTSIKTQETNRIYLNLNKKFASALKVCNALCILDPIKNLNLRGVQPIKSMQIQSTRKNMSFTNAEIMKIEYDNEILLRKIMSQQSSSKLKTTFFQSKLSTSAINRKKLQKKIEEDNMVLFQRLQQMKSCAFNTNTIPGYRTTYS